MSVFVDVDYASLNKHKEELCGDKVEVIRGDGFVIIVLADGLGSGVKANILATLTSKIIGTMLSMGASIEEAVETIINTLPICKERDLAYSTFSILQVFESGECYLIEFDNPEAIRLMHGHYVELDKQYREINGKQIKESRFQVSASDEIVLVSDGAIHAGVGQALNLGWQWTNVKDYVEHIYRRESTAKQVSKLLLSACNGLYAGMPGDDTTVVCVRIRNCMQTSVLIGPPVDKSLDYYVINRFIQEEGKKVVCGGTTSEIVGRELGVEVETDFNYIDKTLPPVARIEGIDLTTEGVLTMCKALEYVKGYVSPENLLSDCIDLDRKDGASKLTKLLIEESTKVRFLVGRAINPAHQNPDFPLDLGMKMKLVEDMRKQLVGLGKQVEVEYY